MYIAFSLFIILLIISYFWYVSIVSKRNSAREALSGVDVHLKQRLEIIPNILTIAKKFMEHEKALLEEITSLRTQAEKSYDRNDAGAVREHLEAAQRVASRMGKFMLTVENYPDLKSDQTMVQAMQTYNEVEAQVTAARRFYNSAVTALNNSVQIFPGNLIARWIGVQAMPFYEAEAAVQASIKAEDYLGV